MKRASLLLAGLLAGLGEARAQPRVVGLGGVKSVPLWAMVALLAVLLLAVRLMPSNTAPVGPTPRAMQPVLALRFAAPAAMAVAACTPAQRGTQSLDDAAAAQARRCPSVRFALETTNG